MDTLCGWIQLENFIRWNPVANMDLFFFLYYLNRLEICSFSGHKIYPAKGKTYVRVDSR